MFNPVDARQEFERFLNSRALSVNTLGLHDGLEAMLDFYRDRRPRGCAFGDADMLLFQWGTFDWGQGEAFTVDLTRQLILSEEAEDDDIWQLKLVFEFEPNARLSALANGNKWCHSLQELPPFREYVHRSAALALGARHQIRRAVLEYECVG